MRARMGVVALVLASSASGCGTDRDPPPPEPARTAQPVASVNPAEPGDPMTNPTEAPPPEPARAPEPTAPEPEQPAPTAAAEGGDAWIVSVESAEAEVRELIPPVRYVEPGQPYTWHVEAIYADDSGLLWLAEQSARRGNSGLELQQPGARLTAWSVEGDGPTLLHHDPLAEVTLLTVVDGELVAVDYDIEREFTTLLRVDRLRDELSLVAGFAGQHPMQISADGERVVVPELGLSIEPRSGKVRETTERPAAGQPAPDLSRCRSDDGETPRSVYAIRDQVVWVAVDEVKTGLFGISRGATGRLRHCSLRDGSVRTLARLRARFLSLHYAWANGELLFALDGGVFGVLPTVEAAPTDP